MRGAGARYDGLADWYDEYNAPAAQANAAELAELLGPGDGPCLDLGCGTGHYFGAIRGTGRIPVGVDYSADQLRVAAARNRALVRADGVALPFGDGAFPTVLLMWISTDVDDFRAVLVEARRVLSPGGVLLFYGVHPCFNGPCIETRPDGGLTVHPTYRQAGWHEPGPWWKTDGIRRRTGMRHLPLADLLNAFFASGLRVDQVAEPRDHPIPFSFAIRAHRPH
jgi:SAM-dependent methyltransferase